MSKRPLHVLTLVSAAVCVLSAGLVGRSFFKFDYAQLPIGRGYSSITTNDGLLILRYSRPIALHPVRPFYKNVDAAWVRGRHDQWENAKGSRWIGFGFDSGSEGQDARLILPLWLVPLLTAILPVRWWRARRRERGWGFAVTPAGEMQTK